MKLNCTFDRRHHKNIQNNILKINPNYYQHAQGRGTIKVAVFFTTNVAKTSLLLSHGPLKHVNDIVVYF